jgi:uncharacterized protein (DUF342 family)
MAHVQFLLSSDHSRVELVLMRDSEEDKISCDELKEQFQASPFANHLPLENGFSLALAKLLDTEPGQPAPPIEIARRTDAELRIILSRNKLTASAEITQGYGGNKIRNMDLVVAARKAGIVEGLDTKAIGQLVAQAQDLPPGKTIRAIIAQGRPPIEGRDVRFEQLANTLEDRVTRPKELEDGYVDMKDYGKYLSVQEGQELMRRHPPRQGEPGLSVLGKPIPCAPVKVGHLVEGKGSRFSPDDPELLIATRSGIPRRIGHGIAQGMAVEESLSLKAVNLASGHVEFDGTVMVEKDVAEDMRIIAAGDICIGGLVEASYLQAAGSVYVAKGMIGRQLKAQKPAPGKAAEPPNYALVVKAGGDIHTAFVQSGDLTSGGSVYVDTYLYHSRVRAGDMLWVGKGELADGKLIGGDIQVGTSVQAGVIGMPSVVPGLIDLSSRLRAEQASIDQLRDEMNRVNEQEVKLAALINSLLKRGVSSKHEKIQRLKEAHSADHEQVGELFSQLKAAEAEFQRLLGEVKVVARKTLHPGVVIQLLDRQERIARDYSAVEVRVTEELGLEFVSSHRVGQRGGRISKSRKPS